MDTEQTDETLATSEVTTSTIDNILPTSNEEEMKNLMKDLDREQAYREHKCWRQYITVIISIIFVAFQLYATLSGIITAQILRATHLAFVQLLAFLLFPATKNAAKYITMVRCCFRLNWCRLLDVHSNQFPDSCTPFW